MITEEDLKYYFSELYGEVEDPLTFEEWVSLKGYDPSWSDEMIYSALPEYMKEALLDVVMNASWYHDGM